MAMSVYMFRFITSFRASKAKVLRLEKEAQEMEKSMEALRHAQAKCSELEKTNKKLYSQTHSDRKEIIKLREVLYMCVCEGIPEVGRIE